MVIQEVDVESGAFEGLQAAVRDLFPVLCFEPAQTEAFLQDARDGAPAERVLAIEGPAGRAYAGESVARLEFVIPADWQRRYEIVEHSIRALQAQAERRHLRMDVDERVPSHGAYFAGMLPGLGFQMEPRVEMLADGDAVDGTLAPLPAGFSEVTLTPDRAAQVARVLHEAYLTMHTEWSGARRMEERESWSRSVGSESETALRDGYVAVEHEGVIAGVCMLNSRLDAMIISELAVLPEHFRKGLGRYLVTRAMQEMKESGPCDRKYLLSARRKESRGAIALYRSVGFAVTKVFTRAVWRRP